MGDDNRKILSVCDLSMTSLFDADGSIAAQANRRSTRGHLKTTSCAIVSNSSGLPLSLYGWGFGTD